MAEIGEGLGEDPLRTFFRTKVASLGAVVEHITRQARAFISSPSTTSESRSIILQEANHVLIVRLCSIRAHGVGADLTPLV